MISTISPAMNTSKPDSHSNINQKVARHNFLHQMLCSLKKALTERRDSQEKRPQDGKTNPME